MAVLAAYGLPLSAPLVLPYLRRRYPAAMPGVHDVQHWMNVRVTGPGTVLVLAFGIYLASKGDHWDQPFVGVGLGVIVVITFLGGGVVVPATRRMAELARADVEAGRDWSEAYQRVYRRYMAAEIVLGLLVLLAVFFMAAKP
jgi:uncharacterized membrane protein